ncbi:hypothetical protein [Occallatibacter riparius]|uniref:Uncharacterized protein n=1 Tax=Occallatibacter riparius TaxID=1002689 RepID=A0A9J7BYJ1_9BACT|nr:hypothetical protein [Occallatibacter riparius]UWZ86525.1 hypothetical protein MOP44_11395 [Occallatibacter riparius]
MRSQTRQTLTTITIVKPTVIAFFDGRSNAAPEESDALSDFVFYAGQVGPTLQRAGIEFRELDGSFFRVQKGKRTLTFRAGPIKVGYYLIAPGQEPHIEYGVMTDEDLAEVAAGYFGVTVSTVVLQAQPLSEPGTASSDDPGWPRAE